MSLKSLQAPGAWIKGSLTCPLCATEFKIEESREWITKFKLTGDVADPGRGIIKLDFACCACGSEIDTEFQAAGEMLDWWVAKMKELDIYKRNGE